MNTLQAQKGVEERKLQIVLILTSGEKTTSELKALIPGINSKQQCYQTLIALTKSGHVDKCGAGAPNPSVWVGTGKQYVKPTVEIVADTLPDEILQCVKDGYQTANDIKNHTGHCVIPIRKALIELDGKGELDFHMVGRTKAYTIAGSTEPAKRKQGWLSKAWG